MLSILIQPIFDSIINKLHIRRECWWYSLFAMFRTFLIVLVGYVFDVAPSFIQGVKTIAMFFTNQNFITGYNQISGLKLDALDYCVISIGAAIILFVSIMQERNPEKSLRVQLDEKPFALRFLLLYAGIIAVVVFGVYGSGYDAASFVYMQF